MNMIPVSSSAIAAIGYDPRGGHMRIQFRFGRTYDFCGVPLSVYEAFMAASSKGRYYDQHIRDRYHC